MTFPNAEPITAHESSGWNGTLFYKPRGAWTGDFIPFYWQGEFHLFYLKDYRDRSAYGEGTPWGHHEGVPNPLELVHGTPLQPVGATPWRWPWRFELAQRIELLRSDDAG